MYSQSDDRDAEWRKKINNNKRNDKRMEGCRENDGKESNINGWTSRTPTKLLTIERSDGVLGEETFGTTIKINKRDNLLINDHQKASSTLTSPSKALVLTVL